MSLRTKQALILFLATVLPFALGYAAMGLAVVPAYRRVVLDAAAMDVSRLAEHSAWNLAREVSRMERLAAWAELRRLVQEVKYTSEEARQLEAQWARLPDDSPALRRILQNLVARELRWWQLTSRDAAELLVTDAHGRLVAASQKTSDFLQADEAWWQRSYASGAGRIYISDVLFDESAGAWVLDLAVPIHADAGPGSRVVGVLKISLDVGRAFQTVQRLSASGRGVARLVNGQGQIVVAPDGAPPLAQRLALPPIRRLQLEPTGTALYGRGETAEIYAWARLPIRDFLDARNARTPVLYAVVHRRAAEVFEPLTTIRRWMLTIAILTIVIAVVLGYWLADRLVVQQVRLLAKGMRQLARGDFAQAAATAEELTRHQADSDSAREAASR